MFALFALSSNLEGGLLSFATAVPPAARHQVLAAFDETTLGHLGEPSSWFRAHVDRAMTDPHAFFEAVNAWSERLALVMLPVAACALWIVFLPTRRFFLHDHVIFAMHSLSFVAFVFMVRMIPVAHVDAVLASLPVHLFRHVRGVYATGPVATLGVMGVLAFAGSVAFATIMGGLALIGLEAA